jgi:hypothetical protein
MTTAGKWRWDGENDFKPTHRIFSSGEFARLDNWRKALLSWYFIGIFIQQSPGASPQSFEGGVTGLLGREAWKMLQNLRDVLLKPILLDTIPWV